MMRRQPLGWAAAAAVAGILFVTTLAWLLSPGQNLGLGHYRSSTSRIIPASRFPSAIMAPSEPAPLVTLVVNAPVMTTLLESPPGHSAPLVRREISDLLYLDPLTFLGLGDIPPNTPTTVYIPPLINASYQQTSNLATIPRATAPFIVPNGIATWYGSDFHGNIMACGQVYDMYDPTTAASIDYPCGTWLTVTNPATGASIRVQVRDRGRLGAGHIDLSLAAFSALANPSQGVIGIAVHTRPSP